MGTVAARAKLFFNEVVVCGACNAPLKFVADESGGYPVPIRVSDVAYVAGLVSDNGEIKRANCGEANDVSCAEVAQRVREIGILELWPSLSP